MSGGSYNQLAEFQRLTIGEDDEYGGPVETWTTVFKRWVKIKPVTTKEYFIDQAVFSSSNFLIKLDWDKTAETIDSETHRVKVGAQVYDISPAINPDSLNRELIFPANVSK